MYLIFGCMLVLILSIILLCRYRRKKARKKLCAMSCGERAQTLGSLISPLGYCYDPMQDCVSTTIDAPQRAFGYTALFDRYAPRFGMVFDCMPIYFDYRERTWLIECWKGQYGINLGCEVGVYKADALVASLSRKTALFHSAKDEEMLQMSVRLYHQGTLLCERCGRHWWMTTFRIGAYCEPRDLEVQVGITFPNAEMLRAFERALREKEDVEYVVRGLQIRMLFQACTSCQLPLLQRLFCRLILWKNKTLCKLFLKATKPFTCGMDRVLYFYFCLPRMLRRVFCIRKREQCCKKSGCGCQGNCSESRESGCGCQAERNGRGTSRCMGRRSCEKNENRM